MCGILGFNFRDEEKVGRALAMLAHRGPNQNGVFCDEKMTLAHARLSIIDLTQAGKQPMLSEEGDVALVFNGEIYNYQELRQDLSKKYNFQSHSDTEVIIYGYKESGADFFEKLRGMWAFALYDKKNQVLILSRDFFGIKPLLYSVVKDKIYFASELKVLLEWLKPGVSDLDKKAYDFYFHFGYFPSPHTPFLNIEKLEPAGILIFDLAKNSRTFKKLDWSGEDAKENSVPVQDFKKVFLDSVKQHFVSDVPVSVLFSGGNDSSLVMAASKELGFTPQAFHFQVEGKSDYGYAEAISQHLGFKMEILSASRREIRNTYEKLWDWVSEPFADISIIPTAMIYSLVAGGAKVALTGDGGDDLLGGYVRHRSFEDLKFKDRASRVFKILYKLSRLNNYKSQKYLTPLLIRALGIMERKKMTDIASAFLEKSALSHLELGANFNELFSLLKEAGSEAGETPAELFYDIFFYLKNDLVYKTDIASMHSSVEARVPFLDKEIWRFLGRIYGDEKQKKYFRNKLLVKELLAEYLPGNLVWRKKEGFSFSLKNELKGVIERDFSECADYYAKHFLNFNLDAELAALMKKNNDFRQLVFEKYPRFVFGLISNYKFIKNTAKL